MVKTISYEELLKEKGWILIDVRTPSEYKIDGIPGSINIPLFLDEDRVLVGTAYKQQSVEHGKQLGIEFVAKRLPEIFKEVNALSKRCRKVVFYCARGGMRSGSMAALFDSLGYRVMKLEGGYRNYREYITSQFPILNEGIKYLVVHGKTGVGKTKILNRLESLGYSVLDLEKFANHKGSFFGALCEALPQSQKRFESDLYEFLRARKYKYLIVESESKRIGDVYVPDCIVQSMINGTHIYVETDIEKRIQIVLGDYTDTTKESIADCIRKIGRYSSKELVAELLALLDENKLDVIARKLITDYYDALYMKSIDKYTFIDKIFFKEVDEAVNRIIEIIGDDYLLPKSYEEIYREEKLKAKAAALEESEEI